MRTLDRDRTVGLLAFLALAFEASLGSAQTVWVVDDVSGPGVDFTTIQGAIDAASSGDRILIKSGTYTSSSCTVNGKGLVLTADERSAIGFTSHFTGRIENLDATQTVVLRGIRPISGRFSIELVNVAGAVSVEDCNLRGNVGIGTIVTASDGLRAVDCTSLALVRCQLVGNTNTSGAASRGLTSLRSNVVAFDSDFLGDAGYQGHLLPTGCVSGKAGGDGAWISAGSLYARGCSFAGGKGGDTFSQYPTSCTPGSGGDGIEIIDATLVHFSNCTFEGAPSGLPYGASFPWGLPVKSNVSFTNTSSPPRGFVVSSPVREQGTIDLTFTLSAPTYTYLFAAFEPAAHLQFDGVDGPLLLDVFSLGFADFGLLPAGVSVVSLPLGDLPPTVDGAALAIQPLYTDGAWSFVELGNPSHLLAVDSSH